MANKTIIHSEEQYGYDAGQSQVYISGIFPTMWESHILRELSA